MIDQRLVSILVNSRAGAAVSRAIGKQNTARKATATTTRKVGVISTASEKVVSE